MDVMPVGKRQYGVSLSPANTTSSSEHTPRSPAQPFSQLSPNHSLLDHLGAGAEPDFDLPESSERRMWELQLLHNSLTSANPFPTPRHPAVHRLWTIDIPNMAIRDGRVGLLYGIMAHSALNLWTRSSTPKERERFILLQQTYLSMMLREQRRDVVNMNPSNADYLCLSSLKILTHALALVQTLPLDPWEPPIDWLQMGKGAGVVFQEAFKMVKPDGDYKIVTFVKSPPVMDDPYTTILSDHSELDWLLEYPPGLDASADTELDDRETLMVYHKALAYICSVQRAIERREPEFAICRRLGGFAVLVPASYTQYLIERRPRAMVVLAHYMALWLDYEQFWIMGKAGERQIRGINKNLPLAWSYKLDPLFAKFKKPGQGPPTYIENGE